MGAGCVEDLDRQIAAHTGTEQEEWLGSPAGRGSATAANYFKIIAC